MSSEFAFVVENANWPVLLVNDSGAILRASRAASALFGPLESGITLGSSIWASENKVIPELFLARSERSSAASHLVKLKRKDGQVLPFAVFVCPVTKDEERCYALQLFEDGAKPQPAPAPAPSQDPLPITPVAPARAATAPAPPPTVAPVPPAAAEAGATSPMDAGQAHKQKLECALQLSRTVALDFNNALTSILGHTSLILSKMEPNHPWKSSLVEVEKSAEKAAEIAHDLAAFSRQEKDVRTQVAGNMNDVLQRTVEVFQNSSGSGMKWTLNFENKLYTVSFDEAKIQQAFVKVLDNAVQSVTTNGHITVRTRNHDYREPEQDGTVQIAPGYYIAVEFIDNGCGIPADILPRIFEPFFTTKKGPGHRGLGLAWVYGIVTNHGGSVSVSSEVGIGTSVRLYLPATKKIVRDRSVKTDDLNGTQMILMVDDEDLLLTMGEMVLSSFGYRVLTANSGQSALEIFKKSGPEIDLVITDLVMPQMGGRELAEKLRKLSPGVKIICASGYTRGASPAEDDEVYLQKPFTSQDLLRKVKQVLSAT